MTTAHQAARFAVVGGAATATHLVVGVLLTESLDMAPFWANFVAFVASTCVSYFGNLVWTFHMAEVGLDRLPRFLVVALFGLAANQAIVFTTVTLAGWSYRLALAIVLLVVPVFTYSASRQWVFRVAAPSS